MEDLWLCRFSSYYRCMNYRDLTVWNTSMDLVTELYKMTAVFPKEEVYGLTAQMRRSAVSIPSNIAEGSRRGTKKDYRQFVLIAFGSGSELETQIEIVKRLGYAKENDIVEVQSRLENVMKMLNKLQQSLV